ncbi:hypothetical protein [Ancylobacter polymorphus]|uniref:Uncharacterized protein n=2 Tax=Hyphomicrobiales TaxID=356 RepID=A0A9E7A1B6_9HYPH|nr:hypothetical protein [Ancylobacter polymorphus]UOK73772.1 hypothetical protein K9D25_24240 [Ancylobacter polymorphus]
MQAANPLSHYIRCYTQRVSPAIRPAAAVFLMMEFAGMMNTPTWAQTVTPDPGTWRPMAYADLQRPSRATATYTDIWKDAIERNNDGYRQRGDHRFAGGNAPVTEAHFVIWSRGRSVVLSILNTAIGCTIKTAVPQARATVKLCPIRIAIYEGIQVHTLDGGYACFLELEPGASPDPTVSAAYASYDVPKRTLKTGMIVNHKAVDGCSLDVPLGRRNAD